MNTISSLSLLMLFCVAVMFFGYPIALHAQQPALEVFGDTGNTTATGALTGDMRLIGDKVETIFFATLDGVPQTGGVLKIISEGIGDLRINGRETTDREFTALTVSGLVAVSGEILVENGAFIMALWVEGKRLMADKEVRFIAEYVKEDVNQDGMVNILDLIAIAKNKFGPAATGSRADANRDGSVNVLDLLWVYKSHHWEKDGRAKLKIVPTKHVDEEPSTTLAPAVSSNVDPAIIQSWIDLARVQDDGSAVFDVGIAKLEALLAARKPNDTKLLLNYPNPFNPETWIPYQLAEATDVTLTIHAMNGSLIRTLALGHQAAGVYKSKSRAAHWDGHNEFGEQVASGLYFYTLTAGDFSATGKMLVRK